MSRSALRSLLLVLGAVGLTACATAPVHRPVGPLMGDTRVELGIAPHAAFGQDIMGVGGGGWAAVEVHENIDVIAHGFATDFFPYAQATAPLSDTLWGGGLGLRGRYSFFEHLIVGGEVFAAYDQRSGPQPEQVFAVVAGVPAAEQAFEGFWVYTDIQLGIAIPLIDNDRRGPFFGIQEIPLGVAWQVTPWLMLVGEGGMSLPANGGYGSVGVAFRL